MVLRENAKRTDRPRYAPATEGSEGSSIFCDACRRPLVSTLGGTLRERRRLAGTRRLFASVLTSTCAAVDTIDGLAGAEGLRMTPAAGGEDAEARGK